MPVLPFTLLEGSLPPIERGAYILAEFGDGKPQLILMASGSELSLVADAAAKLAANGINVRVVSFASWELFSMQDKAYRDKVLPTDVVARLAVEAGVSMGWERWVGDQGGTIAIDRYGASAPAKTLFEHYGLTVERIIEKAGEVLGL